ncbi:MAG: hypothetical protein ACTTGJ_01570 [Clostridium sp.]
MKNWKKILIIIFVVIILLKILSGIFDITFFKTNLNSTITHIERRNKK